MTILDGKKTSNDIKSAIAISVKEIVAKGSRPPHLAAVIEHLYLIMLQLANFG